MARNSEFWLARNTKNITTGEMSLGKTQKGWQIINIDNNGLVTMHRGDEVFHIKISELGNLNKDLFDLADQL